METSWIQRESSVFNCNFLWESLDSIVSNWIQQESSVFKCTLKWESIGFNRNHLYSTVNCNGNQLDLIVSNWIQV